MRWARLYVQNSCICGERFNLSPLLRQSYTYVMYICKQTNTHWKIVTDAFYLGHIAQNKPNIHSFTQYWYLLVKGYLYLSFSNCTCNALFQHYTLISRGSSNEYSLPQSSYCILRYSSMVHHMSTAPVGDPDLQSQCLRTLHWLKP